MDVVVGAVAVGIKTYHFYAVPKTDKGHPGYAAVIHHYVGVNGVVVIAVGAAHHCTSVLPVAPGHTGTSGMTYTGMIAAEGGNGIVQVELPIEVREIRCP